MTAITGNTFPVRAKLAALGGTWNKVAKCWMVPDHMAEEARRIVSTPVADIAKAEGKAHYCRVGEGWGVCLPEASVPMMAKGGQATTLTGLCVDVVTKSGKVNTEVLGAFVKRTERGFVYQTTARVNQNSKAADWRRYDAAKASLAGGQVRDPGEDSADRWMEGGGVA